MQPSPHSPPCTLAIIRCMLCCCCCCVDGRRRRRYPDDSCDVLRLRLHPPYALAALRPLSISALVCLPWLAWVSLKVSFPLHILGAYAPSTRHSLSPTPQ